MLKCAFIKKKLKTEKLFNLYAVSFVCWGAQVIMGCRDMELCETVRASIVEETCNRNVHCHQLDLASLASVREFANTINRSK